MLSRTAWLTDGHTKQTSAHTDGAVAVATPLEPVCPSSSELGEEDSVVSGERSTEDEKIVNNGTRARRVRVSIVSCVNERSFGVDGSDREIDRSIDRSIDR